MGVNDPAMDDPQLVQPGGPRSELTAVRHAKET